MATEFNYVVNLDQSRVQSSAVELSSTLQMALARGVQGAQLQTPLAGTTLSDAVGSAATNFGALASGFQRFPTPSIGMFTPMVGGTYTNADIAFTPHWGMRQAETSLEQEWLVDRYGLGAAQRMKPPGVGATEFGLAVGRNYVDRKLEAEHSAFTAARTTIYSGMAGLAGWTLGDKAGGAVGALIGGRFGAPGLGRMVGGFLGGMAGESLLSDITTEHLAQREQQRGIMSELGEIAAGGLGYSASERFGFGAVATQAARELRMDVQQMGDILAGARKMGMLPSSLTGGKGAPQQVREDLFNLARSIEEGANALHTSGQKAMEMIRGMTGMGFGAHEGVSALVRMGAASGLGAEAMYGIGMAGASTARQNLMSGRIGFDLFTSSVMAASGAGMRREELSMLGGVAGAGQLLGMHQIQAARGPMGTVQSMAGLTGRGLAGDLYGLGAQALEGLNRGGDLLSNFVHFSVHQDRFAQAGGAKGVRARAKQQLMTSVGLLRDLGISGNDAELGAFALIQEGYNPVQARFVANATLKGGGGGHNWAGEAAVVAMEQDQALNRQAVAAAKENTPFANVRAALGAVTDVVRKSPLKTIFETTVAGATVGSFIPVIGTGAGAALGLVAGAGIALWNHASDESGLTPAELELVKAASPKDRQAVLEGILFNKQKDLELAKASEKFGRVPFDGGSAVDAMLLRRARTGDFSQSVLDLDGSNGVFAKATAALAEASGIHGTESAGRGTIRMNGRFYDIGELKQLDELGKAAQHTATSRKAFESVRAGMSAADAERANQMAENFDKLKAHPEDVDLAERAFKTARDLLGRAGEKYAAHPMSAESRAILESTVTAARLGDKWHLDLSSFAPSVRRSLAIVGGLREHDTASGRAIAGTLADLVADQEGQGFVEKLGGALLSGDTRARRALGTRLSRDDDFRKTVYELAEGTRLADARRTAAAEKHLDQIVGAQAANVYGVKGSEVAHDVAQKVKTSATELLGMNEEERRKLLNVRGGDDAHKKLLAEHWELFANINEDLLTKKDSGKASAHGRTHHPGTAENAIGFGQQESAMAHIERSLRATRSALEKLNQRIPGGTPVPPAQGPKGAS